MNKLFFFIGLFLTSFYSNSQPHSDPISEYIFNSSSRGYQKYIKVNKDSIYVNETRDGKLIKIIQKATPAKDWDNLQLAVSSHKLTDLENLPSPTHHREVDGASFSSLTFKMKEGNSIYSGEFDGTNPHERLRLILDLMLVLEKP